jgi:hypothetical protein
VTRAAASPARAIAPSCGAREVVTRGSVPVVELCRTRVVL